MKQQQNHNPSRVKAFYSLFQQGFLTFLFLYLILLFLDFALPGFASFFLNPHWFLILAGLFATLTAIMYQKRKGEKAEFRGIFGGLVISFLVMGIAFFLLQPFTHTALLASCAGLTTFLIFLFYFLRETYD